MLLAALLFAVTPAVEDVTLDALRAHPGLYAGRIVRLAGQVDQCWNMECALCPLEASPADPQRARCLALDFDRLPGGVGNRGVDMDGAFRYADVVVQARFDPACLKGACLFPAP